MKNKVILSFFALIFLVGIVSMISAIGETSYCCERTTNGLWCQNGAEENCDTAYNLAPTSCESTSYCKLGCCYDSQEGTCMENTPQRVCDEGGGVWAESSDCDIDQCSLGCCLIGNQAAFVTQTRCKKLSSLYGLEIDFRTNIGSEFECIASATSEVKGACVFTEDYQKTCLFTTKEDCLGMENSNNVSFHKDYLCSSESLGTNCGPTEDTTCIEGEDEIYFVDSCGNLANIYDSSKIDSKEYWSKIYTKSESCNSDSSNANSASCGNCDYYLGSTCKKYKSSEDERRPNYGNNVCRDLSCEYEGKDYSHGETWCANSKGISDSLPGSRDFRLICYNGEVTVEPCADYRAEICLESEINGFSTAACVVNKWQDCTTQIEKKDCENTDRRDCIWNPAPEVAVANRGTSKEEVAEGTIGCYPKYSPGFNFWEAESDSEDICDTLTTQCVVVYEKGLFGDEKCIENCECLKDSWEDEMNERCSSLGDCGISKNYIGVEGYNKED